VVEYVKSVRKAEKDGKEIPIVTDYIARSILRIAEGLSYKGNFIRYTYREEMVMDAVENCLKAIKNYDIDKPTRTGKPNAFAYFTQITWYAFLRRIADEKKQHDIKLKYINESGLEVFAEISDNEISIGSFLDQLKDRIDRVKETDTKFKEYKKKNKKRKIKVDSDLSDFF